MKFITKSYSLQKLLRSCQIQSGNSTSSYHTNSISQNANNCSIFSKWIHNQIPYPKQNVEWLIHRFLIHPIVLRRCIGCSWILLLILVCILLIKSLLIRHSWIRSFLFSFFLNIFFSVEINVKLFVLIFLIPFSPNFLNLVSSWNGVKIIQILLPFVIT